MLELLEFHKQMILVILREKVLSFFAFFHLAVKLYFTLNFWKDL